MLLVLMTVPSFNPPQVIARELLGDLAMNGSTTVTINVINENDNSPVFLNSSYFVSIPENIQPPAFIALVSE